MIKLNIINKEIFFYDTGLTTLFEKKCEVMVNKTLSFWQLPLNKINNNIDYKLREKISLDLKSNNNFELFLEKNISIILPRFLIEDYKSINQLINDLKLPTNPKAIVTGYGYTNEIFNIYSAKMTFKKTKLITLQHGNISDSHYWHDFLAESGFQDLKLTWGIKSNTRQLPVFNFQTINSKVDRPKNGNLSVVCNKYYSRPQPFDINLENTLIDTIDLIKNIDNKIQKKTYLKLFPRGLNNTNDFFKKKLNDSNLKYYRDGMSYHQMLKKSRITVFNYESSGFFQNLALNLPCCYYSTNPYEDIKDDYKKFYKDLEKNKILFTNKPDIISHILNVWEKVEDWWFSDSVQKSIKNFNSNLNIPCNKNQNKLINILKAQV